MQLLIFCVVFVFFTLYWDKFEFSSATNSD